MFTTTTQALNMTVTDVATASTQSIETLLPWTMGMQSLGEVLSVLILRLVLGSIFLYLGFKLINKVITGYSNASSVQSLDPSIRSFSVSLIRIASYILLLFVTFTIWGFATTSFVAILGGLSLAVGLALQGSMSNVASGVLILLNKPIQVGDFITVATFEGTVKQIELFHTTLTTFDNRTILIPNSILMTQPIVNFSRESLRRIDLRIQLPYDQPIQQVLESTKQILDSTTALLEEPTPPDVLVLSNDGDIVVVGVRAWVEKDQYLTVKRALLTALLEAFQKKHIKLAHPLRMRA